MQWFQILRIALMPTMMLGFFAVPNAIQNYSFVSAVCGRALSIWRMLVAAGQAMHRKARQMRIEEKVIILSSFPLFYTKRSGHVSRVNTHAPQKHAAIYIYYSRTHDHSNILTHCPHLPTPPLPPFKHPPPPLSSARSLSYSFSPSFP